MTLEHFHSWADVLAYARRGAPLYYQAPLDYRAVRLYPKRHEGDELAYVVRSRTIRIWPSGSTGRGRHRTSDPFTADAGHLDRFRHPAVEGFVAHDNPAGNFVTEHPVATVAIGAGILGIGALAVWAVKRSISVGLAKPDSPALPARPPFTILLGFPRAFKARTT